MLPPQSELEPFQKLLKIEGFVGRFRSLVYALGDAGLAFDRCTKYPRWPPFSQPGQSALLLIDGRKMPRKCRCEQSSFNLLSSSPFLVFKSKFALRSQRIPCYDAQGIYPQLFDIASYSYIGFISEGPKATKFPVLFPVSREFHLTETGLAGLRPPPGSPRKAT